MERDWRQWAKDKGLGKWLRKENLVVLILSGVLLFIIALPTESGKGGSGSDTGTAEGENKILTLGELGGTGVNTESGETLITTGTDEKYAAVLEQKLTDILSDMADVGKVRVMITLKSSGELIVEKEEPVSRSATNENDSQGGSRIVNQVETGDTTVYRTEGTISEPYVVKTLSPEIEGVLVVAEGAGSGSVNKTVTEIVQALFGVEAHKVKVVKMQSQ